jgi:hypothetical protein
MIWYHIASVPIFPARGVSMSETGLQKLAYGLLVALILYVSITAAGA